MNAAAIDWVPAMPVGGILKRKSEPDGLPDYALAHAQIMGTPEEARLLRAGGSKGRGCRVTDAVAVSELPRRRTRTAAVCSLPAEVIQACQILLATMG